MPVACSAAGELEIWGYTEPGNVLCPGQDATAIYTIGYKFESDDESLQLYTELINPKWEASIIIDGVSHVLPSGNGRYMSLSGFELYYPRTHSSKVEFSLKGTVPEVYYSGNYTIFRATWYDYEGSVTDEKVVEAIIVNPSEIESIQQTRENELQLLRNYLDDKYLPGVDLTSAEKKYSDAASAIENAKKADPATSSSLLSDAKIFIDESYLLADKAWADYSIGQAGSKISVVRGMISVYEDKGLSGDSRVWVVRSYVDNADTLLVLASEKFGSSDYDSAGSYAEQAQSKAEQAYDYACSLNKELDLKSPAMQTSSTPKKTTSSPTSTSPGSSGESIDDAGVGDFLQSEVDLDSAIKILSMIGEGLMGAFEFLGGLISMASDN